MNNKRFQSIISALNRYGTEPERNFVQSVVQHLRQEGRLTDQQKLILEGLYSEKTRWMSKAILFLMKTNQDFAKNPP